VQISAWLTPNDIREFLSRVETDRAIATVMATSLYRNRSDPALAAYLNANGLRIALAAAGFSAKTIEAIKERYGDRSLETLIFRPFEMIDRVKGVDFTKALALWRRLSPDRSDRRALARFAITDKIRSKRQIGSASYPQTALISEIRGNLLLPHCTLVTAIAELEASGVVKTFQIHGELHLAHRDAFEAESIIATQVRQRLGRGIEVDDFAILDAMIQQGLSNPDFGQIEAIQSALRYRLSMITGGPGTGKSTVLKAVAAMARQHNPECRIKLVALAARVARAIGSRTGLDADTIHAALGLHPGQSAVFGPHNPLPVDLLFIEEAFMIGNSLLAELLRALPMQCQIVIIGDPQQLPPVMEGKPAEALMTSGIVPTAHLTVNHRSEARDIPIAGKRVMAGIELTGSDNVEIHRVTAVDDALAVVKRSFEAAVARGQSVQILTAMHDGPLGTTAINRLISGRDKIEVGDTVMQTVNDRERSFFNGELAIVVHHDAHGVLLQKDDGSFVRSTPAQSRDLVPAWAISFHKSQGLEYETVILVVSRLHRHMLGQNLLNVGITRAKRRCIIINHGSALRVLRSVNQTAKRSTLLPHMLKMQAQS
jgi:exodeoxyribonuclease V alpha subunit